MLTVLSQRPYTTNIMSFLNVVYLALVLVVVICSAICENCDKNGILLYQDIACKPVKEKTDSCPKRYDCSFSQAKSGCLFKGRNYAFQEEIDSNLTYSGCDIACRCTELNVIICAVLDCPEYFGWGKVVNSDCHNKYELGECCSTGQICNSTADSKTCEVEGTTYKLGQKFYPKNSCLTCVCHENFTGEFDEHTCKRENCNAQIHYSTQIAQNCAPTYFKSESEVLCCPSDFVCPDSNDDIKVVNTKAQQQSSLKCAYGNKKLNLGEGFNKKINKYGQVINLQCECILPPFVTCKEI